ncbi:hypothetical protein PP427_gp247 [Salmonella phage KM16]|uniref:hypothetical protein n=1 Tax=Salmonella phage KM16 TaxID=2797303 RepID=UPI0024923C6D|nr:hypothetical protein PP427_gp247 [Salmonella phage KM16]
MSYKILLEVTVMSSTGHVAVSTEQLDFYSWDNANMYYEAVEIYEETPDIKVWRQVTKLY